MKKYLLVFGSLVALMVGANAHATAFAIAITNTSAGSPRINQVFPVNIQISNAGSSFNLTGLKVTANYNGVPTSKPPFAISQYNFGPNAPVLSIAGPNTTTTIPVSLVFFAPSNGITGTGTGQYYIGATIYGSDGSTTGVTTAARATVNAQPFIFPENQ